MSRGIALLAVLALLALTSACEVEDEPEGMTAVLPELALPTEAIVEAFQGDYGGAAELRESRHLTNVELADEFPPDLLYVDAGVEEREASGRADGYLFSYTIGEELFLASAAYAVDLYETPEQAQRALERPPYGRDELEPASDAPEIGDATVVWPTALMSGRPGCPCELRFRVGPFVVGVRTSRPGPSPPPELDEAQIEIARLVAARILDVAAVE